MPCYREAHCREGEIYPRVSAPESCVFNALVGDAYLGDYTVRREIPLADVEGIRCSDPETRKYIQNGARFDIVLCKNNGIFLIIEVDGAYHREPAGSPDAMAENDWKKNLVVRSFGKNFYKYRYLRLPTDGTTSGELQLFTSMLKESVLEYVKIALLKREQAMPGWILTDFKDSMRDICAAFREEMNRDYTACLKKLFDMSFAGGELPDYEDKVEVYYYLLRYAMAYTFEYAQMYQIALSFLEDTDRVKVYAFGCGSQNDCVSLCYVRERLDFEREKRVRLAYTGVDLVRWPVRFSMATACQMKFYRAGMQEFVGSHGMGDCDILCFPKILSELKDNFIIDQFCENLKCMILNRKRLVLCVSHRGRDVVEQDLEPVKKIIKALNENGYKMADVGPVSSMPVPDTLKNSVDEFEKGGLRCYGFLKGEGADSNRCIDDVDPNFEIPDEVWSCTSGLAQENEDKLRHGIKKVRNMCFQVFLFQKK